MHNSDYTWDFFIAHAGADKARAESLYSLLAKDAQVFLDSICLKLGDDWDRELARAQKSSRITIVLVSANTDKAYYEREEIAAAIALSRADEKNHRVVPIYMNKSVAGNSDIPYGLRLKHGLTVSNSGNLIPIARKLNNLLRELKPETSSECSSDLPSEKAPIVTGQYNTAAIRQLLKSALSDEDLAEMCMDHFPAVYEQLSSGMGKSQKIQRVIEHCSRHREIPKLFDLVRQINPSAYALYENT